MALFAERWCTMVAICICATVTGGACEPTMALFAERWCTMVAICLSATVTGGAVSEELCKDHIQKCSFYAQDCDFMGRLCPRTCGYCLVKSETQNSSSWIVDDSERHELPGPYLGSPARGSHIGRTARALPVPGLNIPIARSLPGENPERPLPLIGEDSSAAKEVLLIVADASKHLNNLSDDDSLRDGPESYNGFLPTEQYKPLSYVDVTHSSNRGGGESSASLDNEAGYNFVYEEGEENFNDRSTLKNDPVDLRLLDIDYLRETGLLGEEVWGRHKKNQNSLTAEERKIVELFVDRYRNLEESARVFNVIDPLEESTNKFIKFYEAENSPAFTEFLYRLFTNNSSPGRYEDYFSESEEQVAKFIDAILTFDVNNLKLSI